MKLIKRADNLPWAEKYRPQKLEEIRGNRDRIEALQRLAGKPGSIPHLLFHGPAGTGKTSAARAIATEIGATWEKMNASDERNLHIIQNKVKEYATTASLDGKQYKVLIMDECDRLTPDAQNALRSMMEDSAISCRFFMVCNEMDGIIKPIRSRCAAFYFEPIPDEEIKFTLEKILQSEGYEMEEEAGNMIVARARGDLRAAINTLQMVCDGASGTVESSRVRDVLQASEIDGVEGIMGEALAGNFDNAMSEYHTHFKGYAGAQDFIEMVQRDVIQRKYTNFTRKVAINLSYLQMGTGRNDYLQVMGFLARLGE